MTNPLVDARPIDVAILYGQGQKDRAQHIARELRTKYVVVGGDLDDSELRRVRDKIKKEKRKVQQPKRDDVGDSDE